MHQLDFAHMLVGILLKVKVQHCVSPATCRWTLQKPVLHSGNLDLRSITQPAHDVGDLSHVGAHEHTSHDIAHLIGVARYLGAFQHSLLHDASHFLQHQLDPCANNVIGSAVGLSVGVRPLSLLNISQDISAHDDESNSFRVLVCSSFHSFFDIQTMAVSGMVPNILCKETIPLGTDSSKLHNKSAIQNATFLLLPRDFDGRESLKQNKY